MQKTDFNSNHSRPAFGAKVRPMIKIMKTNGLTFQINDFPEKKFSVSIIPTRDFVDKHYTEEDCVPAVGVLTSIPSAIGNTISEAKLNLLKKLPDRGTINIGYTFREEEGALFKQHVTTKKIKYDTLA